MELDPARAEVEAARRLLDRALAEVEPDERDEPALRALGEGERAVVGRAEGRMPVGLVEAEHEGARDAGALLHPRASSSKSPTIPSMSVPRWVWTSKISAPAGSSARTMLLEALEERLRRARARRPRARSLRTPQRRALLRRSRASAGPRPCRAGSRGTALGRSARVADRPFERLLRRELAPVAVEPVARASRRARRTRRPRSARRGRAAPRCTFRQIWSEITLPSA